MDSEKIEIRVGESHNLILPDALVTPFLETGKNRAEVVVEFEGKTLSFHAALRKYKGRFQIMFSKNKQKELGVFPNDYIRLYLRKDTTRYGVEMPEELTEVFYQDPEAHELFKTLSDGACRSVIYAVLRYKTPQRRVELALEVCNRLKDGIRSGRELVLGPKSN
ncbi:Bacteriocin-protection, YdeI or OmpD-Associated [Robiginitalea myxolifaciens]|uniref:Bacteriocin-protection, YdeI or OmpD-Associated n=1 Tax=Robiginitalea myxolifaciens TaxID=400055 RepID=A0A1I6FMU9_9FLAO|nr:YdeI/OmpD-associated family protein [Robiginitalea myxolifaciens]SFR31269.1 Bacteriocin-protection, YdeI or OmpD-Associated [Robiginitalea myxolifaciens]